MPGRVFNTNLAVPMRAPVLPALTQACARPSFTRSMATRIDESFLVRMAVRTSSSMPTTSEAATISTRARIPGSAIGIVARASSRSSGSVSPTSSSLLSRSSARKSRHAGTVTDGPWSPPMASTAMTIIAGSASSILGLDDLLAAVVARRRDVVAQVRFARGGLDGDRRGAEVVVRPVHPALGGRLLVLLNGHEVLLMIHFFLRVASAEKGDSFLSV